MKELYLINSKLSTQVSDEDYLTVCFSTWRVNSWGYIAESSRILNKECLHIIIAKRMGLSLTNKIDHEDRNPFNNQRFNLRVATQAQNVMNSDNYSTTKALYRGVSFNKQKQKYHAYITVDDIKRHLGFYDTEAEAIVARKEAEKKYFGNFAHIKSD